MKQNETELLKRDFRYWVGQIVSSGADVPPKDREYFLTTLKKKYRDILTENQKLSSQINGSFQNLRKELAEERKLNSELTEETTQLNAQIEEMKCCEICEYGGNVCRICYSKELCNNKDKWKLSHRLSERKEYRKNA